MNLKLIVSGQTLIVTVLYCKILTSPQINGNSNLRYFGQILKNFRYSWCILNRKKNYATFS